MKKILFLLIAIFLMSGCGEDEKVKPEERVTVHIEKRANGLAYEQNQKKPFTGVFEGYYRNGYKKAEIHFKNGKQHGSAKMWYENGQQSHEANFYDGKLEGLATEFRKDGSKYKDRVFRDGKLTGTLE
jgi:antitoxin component YwqK of YwqJK toxin-antitoxin module